MEYKGLFNNFTTEPSAAYSASSDEVESAKLGYLASGDDEALKHIPLDESLRQPGATLSQGQARHIVAGNIRLLDQLSQSELATQTPVFATVTEYVVSGTEALQQGALEAAQTHRDAAEVSG
jgi:hypothetical protein